MRTGGPLNTVSTTTTTKATFSPPAFVQRSPWHSPLPYLFGGLAAMLALIAFALLMLACSYWKMSTHLENSEEGERDPESGEDKPSDAWSKALLVFEEKILVIMAGDVKPTFLATRMSSTASSFGNVQDNKEDKERGKAEMAEKPKQETGHHDWTATTIEGRESRETQENPENQQQNQ